MCNKHEVLMLKSIRRAFENIWCSYFSCQQGSEALILHFYLYLFFTEFLRALILPVHSSLPSFFHRVADTCPWIEPFSIIGWIGFGGLFFFFYHKALALVSVHWYADYPSFIYPPFFFFLLFFNPHFGWCHSSADTGIAHLLQNH